MAGLFSLMRLKRRFEKALGQRISSWTETGILRDACAYALGGGGKRLRPLLVLAIAEAVGKGREAMPAAIAVEFFHTASLIADDLPAMDNDEWRRGRPALHKAFPEGAALLASYALLSFGYGALAENGRLFGGEGGEKRTLIALETVSRCAGLQGATQGQCLDLYYPPKTMGELLQIYEYKTTTLFEVCFTLGWLFGGGELGLLDAVKQCARHLGIAFQIADDWGDLTGVNIRSVCDEREAASLFEREKGLFERGLQEVGLWTPPFQQIMSRLKLPEPLRGSS